jgi:FlaA1/EpsC-like NDP-sugar epimerase
MRRSVHDAAVPVLKAMAGNARSRHLFTVDVLGTFVAAMAALVLYLSVLQGGLDWTVYLWIVGIIVATRVVVDIGLGVYGHSWRHASVGDMLLLAICAGAGTLLAFGIVSVVEVARPQSVVAIPGGTFWIAELFLSFTVLATSRFSIRAASDLQVRPRGRRAVEAKATLLYGAGWAGVILARSAARGETPDIIPVGFLDDDPELAGKRVSGLRVFGGLEALAKATRHTAATSLLITMPNAPGDAIRRIVEAANAQGLAVRTVPPVTDLLDGSLDATRIRQVRVEDLLRRPLAKEHTPAARDVFTDRTVVVTGAAGSIGSELARQVMALEPRHIALLDQAESALFFIEREMDDRVRERRGRGLPSDTTISAHLVDIADVQSVRRLFASLRPDIVLHAAAYKHVPMLEDHPSKAVETNIGGTLSVLEAAETYGVDRFVLVSTDKAVWPSSVMGASKRLAEMVVADTAARLRKPYITVRFGNVLGSNGSVVPIFQDQLEKGQPLTITDPDMTRYFMTIPEASWLILDAAAIADSGGLFVLDMGEPVRIMDIARDLVRLSGRDPDSVPIKVVGLRKGEKLHEELFYDQESVQPTAVPKVLRAEAPAPPEHVREDARGLLSVARQVPPAELARSLHAYVRASVESHEGLWGAMESGALGAEPLGTRPVVIVPIHANGQRIEDLGTEDPNSLLPAPRALPRAS